MKVTLPTTLRAALLLGTAAFLPSNFVSGTYAAAPAPAAVTVSVAPDQGALVSGTTSEVVLKLQVCGHEVGDKTERLPLNVAVVLDRSGSMSGAKIEQAKQAASHLVRQLGAADRFSLVTYDDRVEVLIPPAPVLEPAPLLNRIATIQPGGSTALYAGVSAGAEQLKTFLSDERVNRVILLSDGIANVGPSSPAEISALGRSLASAGIPVTTVGLGADYQEDVLSSLAEASDANYYYVADIEKLPEVFGKEFEELQSIVARDVKVRIECPEGVTPIGFAGHEPGATTIRFGSVSANQQRDVYFRCRVSTGSELQVQDVAVITTEWSSTDGTRTVSAPAPARVEIVASTQVAEAREDAKVVTDWEIARANLEKKEAIAAADAGESTEARRRLSSLRDKLSGLIAGAPQDRQIALQEEVSDLDMSLKDFDDSRGRFTKDNRKALQSQLWRSKNAKK